MNSIGDKNHQSYTKIKRRKTKKIDKNFILDEPEETLNAKN